MIKTYTQNGSLIIEDQLAAMVYTVTLHNPGALVCVYDAKKVDNVYVTYQKRIGDKGEYFFNEPRQASEFIEDMVRGYVDAGKYKVSEKISSQGVVRTK